MGIFDSEYIIYPETKYIDGDKKFGELVKGDFIYNYCPYTNKLSKFVVRKGLHHREGYLVISIKSGNDARKSIYADFGKCGCQYVELAKDRSVLFDYNGNAIYGTNPKSLIKEQMSIVRGKIKEQKEILDELEENLSVLEGLQEESR